MPGRFLKVRCRSCDNEQIVFERAATTVTCAGCGDALAAPTGGKADLTAEILEPLESR